MKPSWKKVMVFSFVLIFAGSLGFILPGLAQEELEVKIGDAAPSVVRHAHEHDITIKALKRGKTEYLAGSGSQNSHRVTLTKQQIADILNGTTVIVQTDNSGGIGSIQAHRHKVTVTLKIEKEERSGW